MLTRPASPPRSATAGRLCMLTAMTGPRTYDDARARRVNERPESARGDYVLYWMQMHPPPRRTITPSTTRCAACQELGKPLVVYEGCASTIRGRAAGCTASCSRACATTRGPRDARSASTTGRSWSGGRSAATRAPGRGLARARGARRHRRLSVLHRARSRPPRWPRRADVAVFAVDAQQRRAAVARCGAAVSPRPPTCGRASTALRGGLGAPRGGASRAPSDGGRAGRSRPSSSWRRDDLDAFMDALPLDRSGRAGRGDAGRRPPAARGAWPTSSPTRLRGYAERARSRRRPRPAHASGPQPVPALRPHRDRGGRGGVLATTGTGAPTVLRVRRRGKREGFFCGRRRRRTASWTRRSPGGTSGSSGTGRGAQDTGPPRDGAAGLGAGHAARARGDRRAFVYSRRRVGGGRDARPALERRPAGAGGDRHHPQLPADAVGQEGDRVVAHRRGGLSRRSCT